MQAGNKSHNAVNLEELQEIMSDDMNLIHECFTDFLEDWPVLFFEVERAILEENAEDLDKSAHKLKGMLKYLAAQTASDAAYIIESAGKKNNITLASDNLSNLKNECQRVEEYIHNFKY